ncbi:ribosome small subunit-dependent GTPase A [Pseudoflavonifractor sp. SW1122]|uniref:ribosome small subunit-dependent GTPase A n=1 Tax=unclassified Pseudoflavonifractor TaxID=2628103 RepID=UPI000B3AF44A|nr:MULTISPECIES: ribosome small subunit-dependent GTPase A [unclassified Pseudoflavonifractor]NJE73110.1 ribosome small subunit-dependent GTPase A [Pseudoflavonifractor sp. SW1122]OUP62406.1 ribosome small subunit-dependent GTPase A [Pseudoflavonifractor sp. An176]
MTGTIIKALSGFYYVDVGAEQEPITCRGRGKLRHQKITPLVGDHVAITVTEDGTGMVDEVLPRSNQFQRPMVANMDQLVILASGAIPVTDPFLIDRMVSLAEYKGCQPIICFNKCDLEPATQLVELYQRAGFQSFAISAQTGEGLEQLLGVLDGKISAFTGNSGVGKSSVLNALCPQFGLKVGQVSEKLGRGRHTTRHVELFRVGGGLVADTPGFSAFDVEQMELIPKEELANTFREFHPYLEQCRFVGCAHVKERGCAVREAVDNGAIAPSRYQSYVRLYDQVKSRPQWEK